MKVYKKGFVVFVLLLCSLPFVSAISFIGLDVVEDSLKAYFNVSPAVVSGDGCINATMHSKQYSGNVNILLGVDTDDMRPVSIFSNQPYNETRVESYSCDGVGQFYNYTLTPKVFYCYQNQTNNQTNATNTTLIFSHSFDTANATTKTAYWTTTTLSDWSPMAWSGTTYNVNLDGKNKWFAMPNYYIPNGVDYKIKICFDVKETRIGETPKTYKYDFGFYPSSYGLSVNGIKNALADGNLFYIDPWVRGSIGTAYYKLDDPLGSAIDVVNGYNLSTIVGSPNYNQTGIINYSIGFFGTQAVKSSAGTQWGPNSNNFSICAWVYENDTRTDTTVSRIMGTDSYGGSSPYFGWSLHWPLNTNKPFFEVRNTSQGLDYTVALTSAIGKNQWHFLCAVRTPSSIQIYINGSLNATTAINSALFMGGAGFLFKIGCADQQCFDTDKFKGKIDEVSYFNGVALDSSDISYLFNSGSPGSAQQYPFVSGPLITFLNQTPSDITTTNIVVSGVGVSYNATGQGYNLTNTSLLLYYKTNTSTMDGVIYINGTLITGFRNATPEGAYANNTLSYSRINFTLDDNNVLPGSYNINPDVMEVTSHVNDSFFGNSAVKIQLLNVSNTTQYNYFEVMANARSVTSSVLELYYCNSSYSTNNFLTSSNCGLANTLSATTGFNHTHHGTSAHNIIPVTVINGKIGSVQVTPTSYFIIHTSGNTLATGWNYSYISPLARTGATQTTLNHGLTWSDLSGSLDGHFHFYQSTDALSYYMCVNDTNGGGACSNTTTDSFNLTLLPPTAPTIYSPTEGTYYQTGDDIFFNYSNSTSPTGQAISNFTIRIRDENQTIVRNITTQMGLTYTWANNLTKGTYYASIIATDNTSLSSSPEQVLFYINNAPIATSAKISPTIAYINSTLNGFCNVTDVDNDVLNYSFIWYKNNTILQNSSIVGDSNSELLISTITNLSRYYYYNLSCQASDSVNISSIVFSNQVYVNNSVPVISSVFITNLTSSSMSALCLVVVSDLENDSLTAFYEFSLNGSVVQNYSTNDTLSRIFYRGENVSCAVKVFDGLYNSSSVNNSVLVQNSLPTILSFKPFTGSTIYVASVTLNCSASDVDGDNLTYGLFGGSTNPPTNVLQNTSSGVVDFSGFTFGDYFVRCLVYDGYGVSDSGVNSFSYPNPFASMSVSSTGSQPVISYDDVVREEIKERNLNILQALFFRLKAWLGQEDID